jgi:NAD(P)-dependent dehydrogenase (short-subunit alcohol dehydrogenase family)/putative sterol carrier protein
LPAEEAALEETVRFDGRVAVVTGAGGGLGRVYALELARRGAKVLVNDLGGGPDGEGESSAPADRVVDEIRAAGGEAAANYDSAADADGGRRIIDAAVAAFGRVDVLINNAGILRDKTLAKMTPDLWDPVMDVHLKGAYNVTRPAFIQMREQGYGRIVLTSSAAGLYGNFGQTNYSAAKMGLVGFMNTVKLEGQKHDILINTVAPAAATRLTEGVLPADMADRLQPEFVAPLVLHLCSEENQDSGLVFNAGLGAFNRTAVVTGAGAAIGDGVRPPTVEDIHRHFAEIDSLEAAREHPNATAALMDMMAAFQPEKEASDEAQAEADSVEAVLKRLLKTFRPEAAEGLTVVFDFDVTGPAGGRYAVAVREGACELTEGPAERPDVALTMTDADFMDMMTGGLSPAAAFAGGKLNISGDVMKAQLIERLFQLKE